MKTNLTNLLAGNFDNVGKILESFLSQWWGPAMGVLSLLSVILALVAGLKYIHATESGDEQEIKKAKGFIKGIFIGIIVVFVVAAVTPVVISCFQSWYDNDIQEYTWLIREVL